MAPSTSTFYAHVPIRLLDETGLKALYELMEDAAVEYEMDLRGCDGERLLSPLEERRLASWEAVLLVLDHEHERRGTGGSLTGPSVPPTLPVELQ